MHEFRIWAPRAQKLRLKLNEREPLAMEGPDARGWWCLAVQDAGPGTDYAFLVDNDPTPYPDPRSGGSRAEFTPRAAVWPECLSLDGQELAFASALCRSGL